MRCYLPITLFVGFVFVSCAKLGIGDKPKLEQGPSPYGAGGIPPKMRRKLPGSAPTTPLVGGVGAGVYLASARRVAVAMQDDELVAQVERLTSLVPAP